MCLDDIKSCHSGSIFNDCCTIKEMINISLYECQRLVDFIPALLPGRIHFLKTDVKTETGRVSRSLDDSFKS